MLLGYPVYCKTDSFIGIVCLTSDGKPCRMTFFILPLMIEMLKPKYDLIELHVEWKF